MLEFIKTNEIIIYPLLIFCLKTPELVVNAFRIIMTAKGYKFWAAFFTFIEASLGVMALTLIFTKLDNPINILAYALGMGAGSYLGVTLEKKIAMGVVLVRVITQVPADKLLENLRKLKFRVTEVSGESNYGRVGILFAVVKRNNVPTFIEIVTQYNPKAFYTIEEINHVSQAVIKGEKDDQTIHLGPVPGDDSSPKNPISPTGDLPIEDPDLDSNHGPKKSPKESKGPPSITAREIVKRGLGSLSPLLRLLPFKI